MSLENTWTFDESMEAVLSGRSETKNALGGSGPDGQSVNAPNVTEDTLPGMVPIQEAYELMDGYANSVEEFKELVENSENYEIVGETEVNKWIGYQGDFE